MSNGAFNGLRGIKNDAAYREYIANTDEALAIDLANRMRDGIQAARGRTYKVDSSFVALYATAGTFKDYAFSRHFVHQRQAKVFPFTIEWGSRDNVTPFHPPDSEMQNIIQEVTAGLLEFLVALTAASVRPALDFIPTSIGFGLVVVGDARIRTLTIKNITHSAGGVATVSLSRPPIDGSFWWSEAPSVVIPPGGELRVSILFTAQGVGLHQHTLTITSTAPGSPQQIPLSGTGREGIVPLLSAIMWVRVCAPRRAPRTSEGHLSTSRDLPRRLYSPKCLEEEFCELRLLGILGSSTRPYTAECLI